MIVSSLTHLVAFIIGMFVGVCVCYKSADVIAEKAWNKEKKKHE